MKKTIIKKAKNEAGLFWLLIYCILVSIPALSTGDGLIHGWSTVEKIKIIAVYLTTGCLGYGMGYLTPAHKWFISKKELNFYKEYIEELNSSIFFGKMMVWFFILLGVATVLCFFTIIFLT